MLQPKNIFLIDSLGALLSAVLLLGVLLPLDNLFGMPRNVIYPLSVIPLMFFTYSACCHFLVAQKRILFLRIIITANILYCFITGTLVFIHLEKLTMLGSTYFVLEIIVIIALVFVEWKVLKGLNKKNLL